ncbi:hypothetical protein TWF718_002578 [Orbilia javanica]|uniref:Uncharacterized protein n=1 Tax=Orbilia javanica TaxID=47235 RepID=A0AAN8RCK5_9PEZI
MGSRINIPHLKTSLFQQTSNRSTSIKPIVKIWKVTTERGVSPAREYYWAFGAYQIKSKTKLGKANEGYKGNK